MTENTPEEKQKQVKQLREWISKQPHLPQNFEDRMLLRFLHSCYYNMEHAKSALELFVSIRSSSPELLNNRDPLSDQMQKALKIANLATYKISGNRNVWIWQLNDPGLEKYDYTQDAKMFFLSMDAWLLTDEVLEEMDIVIMDVKDISLKFITKFNMSVARKLSKYQEEALPIRLKQIHIVNAPPFIDKIYSIMKSFIKQEITQMIHFHVPKSETILGFLSKDELPSDYGGNLDSMDKMNEKSLKLLMDNREQLLNESLWRMEKKSKNKADITTEVGAFRTLAID